MTLQPTYFLVLATATETATQSNAADNIGNIIGIGGIIATIITCLISCIVTWKLTMRSIKQPKLTYSQNIICILSNSIQKQQNILNELSIFYGNKKLKNPHLLLIEIQNSGNQSIANPPICIRIKNNTEIIPGYFQEVPAGYESKWRMEKISTDCCNIILEHINPKHTAKVSFFLDNYPEDVIFECPMQDINIQKTITNVNEQPKNSKRVLNRTEKVTCISLMLTVMLFISMDLWMEILLHLNLNAPIVGIALFIFSILVLSIVFNVFGIKKIDNYISKNKTQAKIISIILLAISLLLTYLILNDILFTNFNIQTCIAVIVVFMLALMIHILSIECL